jgi:hypothetical protein
MTVKMDNTRGIRNWNGLTRRFLPAIVVVGSSLVSIQVDALELGELTVQSYLGQPLRASIAYTPAPSEQLANNCITVRPNSSVSDLPGLRLHSVNIANGFINLTGNAPVFEPIVSLHVVVNCPYTANLGREYLLFIDPSTATEQPEYQQRSVVQNRPPQTSAIVETTAIVKRVPAPVEPEVAGIVEATREEAAVDRELPTKTPDTDVETELAAFNMDSVYGGFEISEPSPVEEAESIVETDFVREIPFAEDTSAVEEIALVEEPGPVSEASTAPVEVDIAPVAGIVLDELPDNHIAAGEPEPGDVITTEQLEDLATAIASPRTSTNVSATIVTNNAAGSADGSRTWLIWLAGSGLALLIGLLVLGRRFLDSRRATSVDQLADRPEQYVSDPPITAPEDLGLENDEIVASDDSPTEENLALDADLVLGTGFEDNSESHVSQDFGAIAETEVDIELPFEPIANAPIEIDLLDPIEMEDDPTLHSDIMTNEDDDYSISMVVDATKMPQVDDVTEFDLQAVEVAMNDETLISSDETMVEEVDRQALERDYEDELTATQTLNADVARAAEELALRMAQDDKTVEMPQGNSADKTMKMPTGKPIELEETVKAQILDDATSSQDETLINDAIDTDSAANDKTVEMPVETGKAS